MSKLSEKISRVFEDTIIYLFPPLFWTLCKSIGKGKLCKVKSNYFLDEKYKPISKVAMLVDYQVYFTDYEKTFFKVLIEDKIYTFYPLEDPEYFGLYGIDDER